MRKRMVSLLLAICLIAGVLVFPAYAETVEGIYGDNIKWHFDDATGTLTISGTGVAARINEASGEAYDQYRLSIRHVVIEDGITEIAPYAFNHIYYLESVWIGDTVKIIGNFAFGDNRNVTQLYIGKSVTTIGEYAFGYMESLQSLVLPTSVREIGVHAFHLCGITELIIPEGVTVIHEGAFSSIENLKRLAIPVSITEIKNAAFKNSDNLADVYYAGTQAQWEAINIVDAAGSNVVLLDAAIHYNHTHTWDAGTVTKAPGCKTEGEKECICTECGATGTVKIAPQHTWDSGTTNADTTVTYECTKCKETKTEGTPVTETEPPVTEPPVTEPPVTEPPVTEPPATEPPVTESPATEPPATEPPATDNATVGTEATDPVDTNQETPGEIPWLVIGIGAAVVLVAAGVAVWIWLRKRNPGSQT